MGVTPCASAALALSATSWSLGDVAVDNLQRPDGVDHWRPEFQAGTRITGPTSISGPDATLYLPPGSTAEVIEGGNILVEVSDVD